MSVVGQKVNAQFRSAATTVLTANHKYGHSVIAKARSKLGIYQEYGVKSGAPLSASSALDGYVKADYSGPHFDLRSTYFTSKQTGDEFSFIPKGLPVGSTLAITARSCEPGYGYTNKPVGEVEATYKANYIAATAKALTDSQKHTLDASLVLATPYRVDGISIGGQLLATADNNGAQLSSAEVGVQYRSADYTASCTTVNNLSSAVASWHQQLSAATAVAAQFEAPIKQSATRALHLGVSHQVDRDTLVQAKASVPTGGVSLYLEKKVGAAASTGSWLAQLPRGVIGIALATSSKAGAGLGVASIDNYGIKYEIGEF